MAEDLLRQGQAAAHEHDRPDDRMEADDFLADEVQVGRPEFFKFFRVVDVAAAVR